MVLVDFHDKYMVAKVQEEIRAAFGASVGNRFVGNPCEGGIRRLDCCDCRGFLGLVIAGNRTIREEM